MLETGNFTSCFDCKSTKNLRAIHNHVKQGHVRLRVVSTAKVQKIWEQFTTVRTQWRSSVLLFRLQKYKKFESNSQPSGKYYGLPLRCFDCKSTKNLRAIHNQVYQEDVSQALFRLQKYKKFESNSQRNVLICYILISCFDCKSTKNLRAIHNQVYQEDVSQALFRLQKYKKFESNSQPYFQQYDRMTSCFDCKSTKNLRAIHNNKLKLAGGTSVVSTAKVQKIWEQFTTRYLSSWKLFGCFDCKSTKNLRAIHNNSLGYIFGYLLFRLQKYKKFESNSQLVDEFGRYRFRLFRLQKYKKFESNSQHFVDLHDIINCCFDCKSTKNLRAIHNYEWW